MLFISKERRDRQTRRGEGLHFRWSGVWQMPAGVSGHQHRVCLWWCALCAQKRGCKLCSKHSLPPGEAGRGLSELQGPLGSGWRRAHRQGLRKSSPVSWPILPATQGQGWKVIKTGGKSRTRTASERTGGHRLDSFTETPRFYLISFSQVHSQEGLALEQVSSRAQWWNSKCVRQPETLPQPLNTYIHLSHNLKRSS